MGGWQNDKILPYFSRYVKFVVNELQGDVDFWITINEPNVYAFKSFDEGVWPPFKKDRQTALVVMKNELLAHKDAYKVIHETDKADADGDSKSAMVGFAHHIAILQPYFPLNPLDNLQAYFQDKAFNESLLEPFITGEINLSIPGEEPVTRPFDPELKGSLDFIGLNYYNRWMVKFNGERITMPNAPQNDLGWEIYPEGMLLALRKVNKYAQQLNVPIYITENGLDDGRDKKRAKFIVDHVKKVWDAVQEGIPVKGFFYWSLIDNFEFTDGYGPKFGLMTIDHKLRESGNIYREIASHNGVSQGLVDKYHIK
jgi:beta-glucosidase